MNAAGKVFLITGSTDGIGLRTADRLAQLGANMLVHGRSEARVQSAVSNIRIDTNSHLVRGYTADFSSLAAVRQVAEEIRLQHPRIDVIVHNAGVYQEERQLSSDGYEMTWQVNALAPFLLTSLLLDCVTGRIVNVSSTAAAQGIDFEDLEECGGSGHGAQAYSLASLASIMFTYELARRLKAAGSRVTANCLDPGAVRTKMLDAGWGCAWGCNADWGPVGIKVEDANDELVIATDPSLDSVSGAFFVSKSMWPSPKYSYDVEAQQRLWGIMDRQTGASWAI